MEGELAVLRRENEEFCSKYATLEAKYTDLYSRYTIKLENETRFCQECVNKGRKNV